MIRRRLIEHFRKQEWTAVAIDFLIVVLGVFLGLQVSSWHEARLSAKSEAASLVRIQEEFEALAPALERAINSLEATTRATGEVVTVLRSGERPADEAAFRHQLWRTGFLSPVPPLATIYTELTSTGGLSGVSDPELRGALTRYGDACALFAQVQPHAKSALLDPRARYYRAVEWSVDPDAWDRDDAIVSYDWTELREARSELQVWQAYQEEVASAAKLQLKEVRAVLAILEGDRK